MSTAISRQLANTAQSLSQCQSPGETREFNAAPVAMVVDDSPDVSSLFAAILEHGGYEVTVAFSAEAALEAARSETFDFIISDIGMPGMDGYELARTLRTMPAYFATPLIAITGFAEYAAEAAFKAGFNAHLKKPVEPAKLLEVLARLRQ